jgi:hypothetical protein
MKINNISTQLLLTVLLIGLTAPSFARTDGGGRGNQAGKGNGIPNNATQKYNNPSGRENCYYCWKDLSTDYTPSRHKYAKKS